jgi:hypothetical protein
VYDRRVVGDRQRVIGVVLCAVVTASCALDWSGAWPVPLGDSVDQTRRIDRQIEDSRPAGDGFTASPCKPPAKEVATPPYWAQSMKICRTANDVNQCEAGAACDVGWHLCTHNEYSGRGGETVGPETFAAPAWIAACLRDGFSLKSTEPRICSMCAYNEGPPLVVQISCVSSPTKSTYTRIGIVALEACNLINGQLGRWRAAPSADTYHHVICCQP